MNGDDKNGGKISIHHAARVLLSTARIFYAAVISDAVSVAGIRIGQSKVKESGVSFDSYLNRVYWKWANSPRSFREAAGRNRK